MGTYAKLKSMLGWIGMGLLALPVGMAAQPDAPMVVSHQAPTIPAANRIRRRNLPPASRLRINNLKAVLIAGPIDGDQGESTLEEIANLKLAAAELRKNRVQVYEFYTPHNDWRLIRRAARGAHFLLYRGHGVYDGSNPPRQVGGRSLKGRFASGDDIRRDLKLAHGAIVMLYGCFTAGNSGFDVGQIDSTEARRRVSMYSQPFLVNGAAGYYANWYGDAFQYFIANLFAGYKLGEAYKAYPDFNPGTL